VQLDFKQTNKQTNSGSYALYEFLWACNQALLLAALGLASSRPLLVAAGVVAVSVDQVLW